MSSSAPSPPPAGAPPEFYCYECATTVSPSPAPPPSTARPLCPLCHSGFIQESPSPPSPPSPPPPPPLLSSGSSSDSDADFVMAPAEARAYLSHLVHRLQHDADDDADTVAAAAAAAVSVLQHQHRRPVPVARGGEPPAAAAAIAALPTVAVADPAAVCAICKDDLPLASEARSLPCAHLYHSLCIVTWLQLHNSCPVCRFRIPSADPASPPPPEREDTQPATRITIRVTTAAARRRGVRIRVGGGEAAGPVSASPTQLAQAVTGADGAGGPANSAETVSSEWPPHPENDTVMSEAREGDAVFD